MLRRFLRLAPVLVLLSIGQTPLYAEAYSQQANPITLDVRAGFDGYIQSDTWVPITITAANSGNSVQGDLRVISESFGGGGRVIYTRPINLPKGSRKLVTLYPADLGGFSNNLLVDLVQRGRVIASAKAAVQIVDAQTLLIGLLSDAPQSLTSIGNVKPSSNTTRVAILTADDLPPLAVGWTSLDVLVIADADTGKLSAEQQVSLSNWVLGGGRLIIVGGPGYQRTLAGLQSVSPIVGQNAQEASVLPLTSAAGSPLDPQVDADALVTTGTIASDARVVIEDQDTPLLITRRMGYGNVDFLAADPALEPLRSWRSMSGLWRLVLSTGETRPGWAFGFNTNWDSARQGAASIPGVRLPSVLQLCGFLAFYVILIGPANYFVLWRLKKRELAWVTIPALVLVFSAIAYITGFQLRGSEVIVQRMAVVHSWVGQDTAEVQAVVGVWSPRRARYDIQVEQGYLPRPVPQGISSGFTAATDSQVENTDAPTLRDVQVDVGSVRPFVVQGFDDAALPITSNLTVEATSYGLRVTGDVSNGSDLTLENVTLTVGGTAQRLSDLPAGQVTHVDATLGAGQAAPSGGNPFDPMPVNGGYSYYPYYYDPLVLDLVHADDCSGNQETNRRCSLVMSILNGQWRGSNIVLSGWVDTSPVDLKVLNGRSRTFDSTLYLIELPAEPANESSAVKEIPPGLMTWQILSTDPTTAGYVSSPYGFYLTYGTPVTFRFQPTSIVPLPHFTGMEIALETYYDAQTGVPDVYAQNLQTGEWDKLDVSWGITRLSDAAAYIDPNGTVTLKLDSTSGEPSISRFDITLIGD